MMLTASGTNNTKNMTIAMMTTTKSGTWRVDLPTNKTSNIPIPKPISAEYRNGIPNNGSRVPKIPAQLITTKADKKTLPTVIGGTLPLPSMPYLPCLRLSLKIPSA
jgi:hypothetical protein